jgi:hypothetical protein
MLNQKLRNIRNFFFSGKKSISTSTGLENNYQQTGNNPKGKIQILFHRDVDNNVKLENSKAEPMQHDWWIN